ncbi:MAG: hypothetical protein M4579_003653 [Chaenotheca gracillima]|nr:MAG: hypothetical protein M4579_003653 [Chaenotheca gracillima]
MAEQSQSIRSLFNTAEQQRKALESLEDGNSSRYQDNLVTAVETYEQCRRVTHQLSLFSSNEGVEDISSTDLQYLLIDYHLSQLIPKRSSSNRKLVLHQARHASERFLELLDTYRILSRDDRQLHEQYLDSPDKFSTASTTDPAARRNTKIARFREEKELKQKVEYLSSNPSALANDDAALRSLHLTVIALAVRDSLSSLESIAQELQILSEAPQHPPPDPENLARDYRERNSRAGDGYSDRLDPSLSSLMANGRGGPILNKDGRPLQPFTLLDSRDKLRQGVFKSGHNLPTMTIDEYLDEEKRRGGIIEGGGEQSGIKPQIDEDDFEKADEETMKAREWDEFTESNPK